VENKKGDLTRAVYIGIYIYWRGEERRGEFQWK
jgi:hypothetical protein